MSLHEERDAQARGRSAARPWQVPWNGWKDVLWRVYEEIEKDGVVDLAASVAFFGLISLFPALIGMVSLYGLLADPGDVVGLVNRLSVALPHNARSVVLQQLIDIQRSSPAGLRFSLVTSLAITAFTASGGVASLMRGINKAYDERETRGWLRFRALALLLTLGFTSFVIVSVATITLLPIALEHVGFEGSARVVLQILRWPALATATMLGLGILYRYAPNRTPPQWPWVVAGATVATAIWTLASLGFSSYAEHFARFNETYGTLAGAVVLGLWLFLSAFAILLGAELNSELEHQTARDSTIGPERPMGQRGATVADQLGPSRPRLAAGKDGVRSMLRDTLVELNRPRRGKKSYRPTQRSRPAHRADTKSKRKWRR